jgi:hypothetical protein
MIPTTKPKQRDFLETLIYAIENGKITKPEIAKQLRVLLGQMRNRNPVKRGDPIAQTVTPAVKQQIVAMYRRDPSITNQAIADALNLNGGRVSEVLAGKRY